MVQLSLQYILGSLHSNNLSRAVIGQLNVEVHKLKFLILMSKLNSLCKLRLQASAANNMVSVVSSSLQILTLMTMEKLVLLDSDFLIHQ